MEAARPDSAAQAGTGPSAPLPPLKGAVLPGRAQSAQLGRDCPPESGSRLPSVQGSRLGPTVLLTGAEVPGPPTRLPRRCTPDSPPAVTLPGACSLSGLGTAEFGAEEQSCFLAQKVKMVGTG